MDPKLTKELIHAAIGKAQDKARAKELAPGDHEVDMIVHIKGKLKKGMDYMQETNSFPWKKMAIALANRVNKETMEAIIGMIEDGHEDTKALKPQVEEELDRIKESTTKACSGKLTGSVKVLTVTTAPVRVEE